MKIIRKILIAVLLMFISVPASAETYVVAVGIAHYQDSRANLRLPEDDAKSVAKIYKTRTKNVITITGKYATRANIIKALSDQFKRAKSGDMVVFFFSGHGYEGGFCPYDIGPKLKNALSYEDVYAIFRKSKATKKVVIADACMSGGLREENHPHNSQSKKSDVVMFLSSRTNEYSIEKRNMKNGFFTAYLERGLRGGADANKDKVVTAKEIFTFVSEGVKGLSKGRQHPVMWGNFDDNFIMIDWRTK